MNERIQELFSRAGGAIAMIDGTVLTYTDHFDPEKFAELIVRECAGIAYEYDIPNLTGPGEFIGNRMKKHFGVKE